MEVNLEMKKKKKNRCHLLAFSKSSSPLASTYTHLVGGSSQKIATAKSLPFSIVNFRDAAILRVEETRGWLVLARWQYRNDKAGALVKGEEGTREGERRQEGGEEEKGPTIGRNYPEWPWAARYLHKTQTSWNSLFEQKM